MLDDIYQVTISGLLQGQTCQNVLHYQVTADADYVSFGAGVLDWWNNKLAAHLILNISSDFSWTNLRIQKLWPLPAFFPIDIPVLQQGMSENTSMPSEVALVITKQTILAGAKYRGRVYLAGIPFNEMTPTTGLWKATTISALQLATEDLAANIPSIPSGGTLKPVIYHRSTHSTTAINSAVARNVPRAQRRRQIGRGQ